MSRKLTWTEMIKLCIIFGFPFVILLKLVFWSNPTTLVGKILVTVCGIFCYGGLVMIILYLTSRSTVKKVNNYGI